MHPMKFKLNANKWKCVNVLIMAHNLCVHYKWEVWNSFPPKNRSAVSVPKSSKNWEKKAKIKKKNQKLRKNQKSRKNSKIVKYWKNNQKVKKVKNWEQNPKIKKKVKNS